MVCRPAQFHGWFSIAPTPTGRIANSMSNLPMARRSAVGFRRNPTLFVSHNQVGSMPASTLEVRNWRQGGRWFNGPSDDLVSASDACGSTLTVD